MVDRPGHRPDYNEPGGADCGCRETISSGPLSGRFAGKTAVEAVREGDTGKERLSSYNILCEKLQEPKPEIGFASFGNLSEDEQEGLFDRMNQMDDLNFDVLSI